MRHRTAAQRRGHHAKQRARRARYRAWEAAHGPILDGMGLTTRERRKQVYRLRRFADPIARPVFEPELIRNVYVQTADAAALPGLASLLGMPEEER